MTRAKVGVIGANLRRFRQALGWTQEKLAEKSGVHRTTIANLERGGHQTPQYAVLTRLAAAMGTEASELVRNHSTPARTPMSEAVDAYLASQVASIYPPSEAEVDWLRSLPGVVWLGVEPRPEVLHHLVQARRSGLFRR